MNQSSSSIRNCYVQHGVEDYYKTHIYRNPHEYRVRQAIKFSWEFWLAPLFNLPVSCHDVPKEREQQQWRILDLSAGSGEVTNAILEIFEYNNNNNNKYDNANANEENIINCNNMYFDEHEEIYDNETCDNEEENNRNAIPTEETPNAQTTQASSSPRVVILPSGLQLFASDPYTFQTFERRFSNLRIEFFDEQQEKKHQQVNDLSDDNDDDSFLPKVAQRGRCAQISFEDIINGCFFELTEPFDVVFCSYAMHLADEKNKLPVLAMNLAMVSKCLVILTPHKRPVLQEKWGWTKIKEHKTEDRTRIVLYESTALIF